MTKKILILLLAAAFLFAFAGCGKKLVKSESVLDTPENHYHQGMRLLDQSDLKGAWEEFTRAKGMNPKYANAYAGMALVKSAQGNFKDAADLADEGLGYDSKSKACLIAKGRVITAERKGDDWAEDAIKAFDKALKLYPKDSETLYYMGVTYKEAYKFSDAVSAYSQVIENKDDWSTKANADWELVQKIVRAAPGTKVGSKIALMDKIDRADIAVLFMEELKLPAVLKSKQKKNYDTSFKAPEDPMKYQTPNAAIPAETGPSDISSHWAKNWIKEIVELGGMEMYPDHTFHPDELITRAEFALLIQNILIMTTGDETIATKFIGETSHFPDVNSFHPAYNAIVLCVERGIMKANLDGSFGLTANVSGADALLIIREFQNSLRMTF